MTGKKKKEPEPEEDECTWECTVCTFRNKNEAFKCDMCDTRKGTSTRKPRLNDNVVAIQQVVQNFAIHQSLIHPKTPKRARNGTSHADSPTPSSSRMSPESISSGPNSRPSSSQKGGSKRSDERSPRRRPVPIPDNLIFRTSPQKKEISLNGVKATISEFRPRPAAKERMHAILNELRKEEKGLEEKPPKVSKTSESPAKIEVEVKHEMSSASNDQINEPSSPQVEVNQEEDSKENLHLSPHITPQQQTALESGEQMAA